MRLFFFVFLMPLFGSAQFATITGVAPLSAGQKIQLRVYDDPISGKEKILADQIIGADGSFELKVHSRQVQYAFLQVGRDCADFFIERNKGLELTFVPPKRDGKKSEAFNERHFFLPKITGGSSAKLNEQIISFNDTLDAFLEKLYPILVQRKSPVIVAKELAFFDKKVLADFATSEPFVKEYIAYSIAGVEQTFLTDRKRLFDKYLKGKQAQFNNPAFIDFVLQFYKGVVYKMAIVDRYNACKKRLDGREAFAELEKILMEENPMLKTTGVGRIILIDGIADLFGQKDFEDEKLITALKHFGMFSPSSYLGNAARNIAAKHETLSEGIAAPNITFNDLEGQENQLSDFEDNYVFLELTDATNPYCLRETNVIPSLRNEFKNVRFVSICIGNSQEEMEALQKELTIDWAFGGISLSDPAIDNYNIKSLPRFYIINPEGKFYRIPARDPSKGAQSELMALEQMLKSEGKSRVGER